MTVDEMIELFEKDDEYYFEFDKIENKRSNRSDLHVFLLLDSLCPGKSRIIAGAEHDEIFLEPSLEDLAKVITKDQVIELRRCGVMIWEGEGLAMFA